MGRPGAGLIPSVEWYGNVTFSLHSTGLYGTGFRDGGASRRPAGRPRRQAWASLIWLFLAEARRRLSRCAGVRAAVMGRIIKSRRGSSCFWFLATSPSALLSGTPHDDFVKGLRGGDFFSRADREPNGERRPLGAAKKILPRPLTKSSRPDGRGKIINYSIFFDACQGTVVP